MKRHSATKRPRKGTPERAPGAAALPFDAWLSAITSTPAPVESTLTDAVAKWRGDWHAPAGAAVNPLQAARLGMLVLDALGIELDSRSFPAVDDVQACIEAELLADREGADMGRRDRAFKRSKMRSLHLRHALQLVAAARGNPNWEDVGYN